MKIVISINTSWNILNFRSGLIKALFQAGHQVITVAPPDQYISKLEDLGCRFVALPMDNKGTNPVRDTQLFLQYRSILAHERPDVFLGYTIKPNIFGSLAAQSLGIPVINNISGLGTAFIRNSLLTRIVKTLYRKALRRSHRIFFQNDEDRQLFLSGKLVKEPQTSLLPGSGVDLNEFKPRHRKKPKNEPLHFILIARLLRDKGVREYIDAARHIRRINLDVRFQLLGFLDVENKTAINREEVEGWVKEGVIEYLGSTDDVRPFIASADCIVLPSYREGAPRTLLEAAAMAKPLIATNVPGCRDVVEDGRNGFLCKVRDDKDLARVMRKFIALDLDKRQAMGFASRKKVERQFDEKIVIDRYLEAIGEVQASQTEGRH